MNDMFDINLLSQIQALDRKLSIANEKPRLRRKSGDEHKHKGSYWTQSKVFSATPNKTEGILEERDDVHATIDITI